MRWKPFKKSFEPTLNQVTFTPPKYWDQVLEHDTKLGWVDETQTAQLTIELRQEPPPFPTNTNLPDLRKFYEQSAQHHNAGLIHADWLMIGQHRCVYTIMKLPQEPSGITYFSNITIPFSTCGYVIQFLVKEVGATGTREAVLVEKLLKAEVIEISPQGQMIGWWKHPYDASIKDGFLMSLAEKEEYDSDFPQHPLSLVRAWTKQLIATLQLAPELATLDPFFT